MLNLGKNKAVELAAKTSTTACICHNTPSFFPSKQTFCKNTNHPSRGQTFTSQGPFWETWYHLYSASAFACSITFWATWAGASS